MPLIYEEVKLNCGYRIDLLVENKIVIEIKSVETLNDVHLAQILTYLKLSGCKLGLLINFNVKLEAVVQAPHLQPKPLSIAFKLVWKSTNIFFDCWILFTRNK